MRVIGRKSVINRVVLVGRLVRDPELKHTTNGVANLRFTVAVNRQFAREERQADFIGCVAWRTQAENMAKFLRKGSLIGVEGRIETGSYQAQDGTTRYTTDVIADSVQFLEPRSASADHGSYGGQMPQGFSGATAPSFPSPNQQRQFNGPASQATNEPDFSSTINISNDDLPF